MLQDTQEEYCMRYGPLVQPEGGGRARRAATVVPPTSATVHTAEASGSVMQCDTGTALHPKRWWPHLRGWPDSGHQTVAIPKSAASSKGRDLRPRSRTRRLRRAGGRPGKPSTPGHRSGAPGRPSAPSPDIRTSSRTGTRACNPRSRNSRGIPRCRSFRRESFPVPLTVSFLLSLLLLL